MVLLASRLGLHIGDIRELKLQDIDWKKKQISLIQHKTQKPFCSHYRRMSGGPSLIILKTDVQSRTAKMFLCVTGRRMVFFQ